MADYRDTLAEATALRDRYMAQRKAAPAPVAAGPRAPEDQLGEQIGAGIEGAAAGMIGAATAIPQLALAGVEYGADAIGAGGVAAGAAGAREAIGGRELLDSVASIAHHIALPENEADAALNEWRMRARARAQQYAGTAQAGELAGSLAGIAVTGGMGITGAGDAAASGAARLAGGVGGKLASATARGVVEGAAFGAAGAQDEAWVAERQLTGEQVLASAGVSGLLGGALSFGASGAGSLIRGAKGAIRGGASKVDDFASAIRDANDGAIVKAAQETLGEDVGAQVPQYAREIAAGKEIRPKIVAEATKSITDDLTTVMQEQETLVEAVTRSKETNVANQFAKTPPSEGAMTAGREIATSVREELAMLKQEFVAEARGNVAGMADVEAKLADQTAAGVANRFDRLRSAADTLLDKALEAENPAEMYRRLDLARASLLKSSEKMGIDMARIANDADFGARAQKQVGDLYGKLREHLFDESTWGPQGAVQREVNEAWPRYIDAKNHAFSDIARENGTRYIGDGETPLKTYAIQEGRVAGVVDSFGTPTGRDKLSSMLQYLDATERLGTAIGKGYAHNPAAAAAAAKLKASALRIRGVLGDVAEKTTSLRQAEDLTRGAGKAPEGIFSNVMASAGISGPAPQAALRIRLEHAAEGVMRKIVRGVDWIGPTAAKAATAAARGADRSARAAGPLARFVGRNRDLEEAVTARTAMLEKAAANGGGGIRDAVQKHLGAVGDADPHATAGLAGAASRGVELLRASLPTHRLATDTPNAEAATAKPSKADMLAFADISDAVDHPVDVLAAVGTGAVSAAQIAAIAHVYPEMYELTRTAAIRRIRKLDAAGTAIPFRQRASVDMLLGLDGAGERVLDPQFALEWGPKLVAQNAPPPPPPSAQKPLETQKSNTESMLETPNE